jgi:hypothetical protein
MRLCRHADMGVPVRCVAPVGSQPGFFPRRDPGGLVNPSRGMGPRASSRRMVDFTRRRLRRPRRYLARPGNCGIASTKELQKIGGGRIGFPCLRTLAGADVDKILQTPHFVEAVSTSGYWNRHFWPLRRTAVNWSPQESATGRSGKNFGGMGPPSRIADERLRIPRNSQRLRQVGRRRLVREA